MSTPGSPDRSGTTAIDRKRSAKIAQVRFRMLAFLLRATGIYWLGATNFRNLRVVRPTLAIPGMPTECDGLRILLLSDLHLGLGWGTASRLLASLENLTYDFAALAGDLVDEHGENPQLAEAQDGLRSVIAALHRPVYAVLGNHDTADLYTLLDAGGVCILNPDTATVHHHKGASIRLVGIPDGEAPSPPATLLARKSGITRDAGGLTICLAHNPADFRRAHALGARVYLCGHTHGGQICLPGGLPILHCRGVPPALMAGSWHHDGLYGFTTRGVGASGLPVRYFCPPEIALVTLRTT